MFSARLMGGPQVKKRRFGFSVPCRTARNVSLYRLSTGPADRRYDLATEITRSSGRYPLFRRVLRAFSGHRHGRVICVRINIHMIAESVSPIQFRLLGPVTASRAQSEVPLSGTKIQTVLAKLLLAGGRTVSDTSLSTALWGHHPPSTSSAQIYTYVSRLRKQLGAAVSIARQGPGYVLDAPHSEVDVFEFERLTALGQRALGQCDYTAASRYFGEGIELWQGEPLENATEHLQEVEVPRLLAARLTALEHRVEADLALGRHHQISAELTGLVAGFPLNERLRAQLITALYRCGRQAEAVHVYHKGRTVLAEQMGVDPGPELRAAYESMLRGEMHGTAAAPAVVPTTLPPVPVPFVGRSRALDLLGAILVPRRAHRAEQPVRALITGIAGIGKSGLAAVAAHGAAHHYPDGQLHAELCHADGRPKTPGEVLVRLLRALGEPRASADHSGFPALTGDVEELVRLYRTRTAGRRLLLLLDDATGDAQIDPLLPRGHGHRGGRHQPHPSHLRPHGPHRRPRPDGRGGGAPAPRRDDGGAADGGPARGGPDPGAPVRGASAGRPDRGDPAGLPAAVAAVRTRGAARRSEPPSRRAALRGPRGQRRLPVLVRTAAPAHPQDAALAVDAGRAAVHGGGGRGCAGHVGAPGGIRPGGSRRRLPDGNHPYRPGAVDVPVPSAGPAVRGGAVPRRAADAALPRVSLRRPCGTGAGAGAGQTEARPRVAPPSAAAVPRRKWRVPATRAAAAGATKQVSAQTARTVRRPRASTAGAKSASPAGARP
ncbi:regulatory protein [Streptomyces clavuligerus]|nr:regulatory protein [Streptomyces clavuligerus]